MEQGLMEMATYYLPGMIQAYLVAWWLTNNTILQALFENLADQSAYFNTFGLPILSCSKCMSLLTAVIILSTGWFLPSPVIAGLVLAFMVSEWQL